MNKYGWTFSMTSRLITFAPHWVSWIFSRKSNWTMKWKTRLANWRLPVCDWWMTAPGNQRYQGIDTGSSALVGVSNAHRMLKAGDKRAYTVGFRSPDPVVTGTISYEP